MLPITYYMLKSGCAIYWVFVNMCISELCELCLIVRLARKHGLDIGIYMKDAIFPIILTTGVVILCSVVIAKALHCSFILKAILLVFIVIICVSITGINSKERMLIKQLVFKKVRKDE